MPWCEATGSRSAVLAVSPSTAARPAWDATRVQGESVAIPEKRVPHFKPGKALREAVDQRTAEILAAVEADRSLDLHRYVESPRHRGDR